MKKDLLEKLKGGDRRTIGQADRMAAMVSDDPKLFADLMAGLWSEDLLVRMRAADAAEKVTRKNQKLLQPYKKELLGLLVEAEEQELRWHLAVMVPRLHLTLKERTAVMKTLTVYLEDKSSIVKTFALQGLAELAEAEASLRPEVIEILREATPAGTPAMKARSRKLLPRLTRSL
jgi:hypothetical protein